VAEERDEAASRRDEAAGGFDMTLERSALDRRAAASDRVWSSQDRLAGAAERTHSGLDRDTALDDRGSGATGRLDAELDRQTSLADRGASAKDRAHASVDGLTGAYVRGAGMFELEREMARARRTKQRFVLVFLDVDNLKKVNDVGGHAAGDRLLVAVAEAQRSKLRAYDLIVRYGGDEFVCGLTGLAPTEVAARFDLVNGYLAEQPDPGSVSFGVAEMAEGESLDTLINRADAALAQKRRHRRGGRDR